MLYQLFSDTYRLWIDGCDRAGYRSDTDRRTLLPAGRHFSVYGDMMQAANDAFMIKSKIWVEDSQGSVVFGLGRYRILEAIHRLGSMNAAARELKMSYRAVWCRIRASEERIGKILVARQGKGSVLTPEARQLMKQFKRLQAIVEKESDAVFDLLMSNQIASPPPPPSNPET